MKRRRPSMSTEKTDRIFDKLDKLDEKFDRKMDKLEQRIDCVDKDLIVYNEQLKHHIEGVRLLKQENEMLREYIDKETNILHDDLVPIKNHVQKMEGWRTFLKKLPGWVLKALGAVSLMLGIYFSIRGKF